MTVYTFTRDINHSVSYLTSFLQSLPNYVSSTIQVGLRSATCTFNHTTQEQKDEFLDELFENGITRVKVDSERKFILKKL